nr:hypothetical protein [Tanacetum cinerariifolium]
MLSRKVKSQQSEPESWRKDQDDSNNEQDSRSEEKEIGDDEEEQEDEFVRTPSNDFDDEQRFLIKLKTEELEFKAADTDMPQDQDENPGNDNKEPKGKVASKGDWFTKPKRPQEPTNPNWNEGKTPQQGTTQNFSAYIINGLKISNLTQETLLGLAFKLLKGTRSNYAELEYDFEEYYKTLLEKLDWDNPEGGDYPFNLTKPLPLVMNGNHKIVLVDYFFNNDLKYLQSGISTMTYMTSLTQTKDTQYDLPGIEDMNRLTNLSGDDVFDFAIDLRMFTRSIVIQKRVDDLQLAVKSYKKKINVTKPKTTDLASGKRTHTLHIKTLKDIIKNIYMEYPLKRRWSTLEKKQVNIMIKAINKQLRKEG